MKKLNISRKMKFFLGVSGAAVALIPIVAVSAVACSNEKTPYKNVADAVVAKLLNGASSVSVAKNATLGITTASSSATNLSSLTTYVQSLISTDGISVDNIEGVTGSVTVKPAEITVTKAEVNTKNANVLNVTISYTAPTAAGATAATPVAATNLLVVSGFAPVLVASIVTALSAKNLAATSEYSSLKSSEVATKPVADLTTMFQKIMGANIVVGSGDTAVTVPASEISVSKAVVNTTTNTSVDFTIVYTPNGGIAQTAAGVVTVTGFTASNSAGK